MATKSGTAIVTGASRGIGAAIAKRLAADGFTVVVNFSGSEAHARSLVDDIAASGGTAISYKADVADPSAVAAMFDAAEKDFGGVDVLVNNAGIMSLAAISETDDAMFDRTVAVNLKGVFNGMREAGRRLRNDGRIINFSTSVVGTSLPNYGVYAATKAAVETLTRIAAKELGKRRITVNAVAPGPVETELFMTGKSEALIKGMVANIPLGRLGQPDDIASVVSFLAGEDGRWISGQILRANGGLV